MKTLAKSLILVFVVLLCVSGCDNGGQSTKIFVKNGTGKRLRVAVLPFENVSRDEDAGRVITNTIITYLLSTGEFDVVEPGIVYATMGSENIRLNEGITVEVSQKLQPKLNADAYIMGMVEEYGEVHIGNDTYPSISFSARLVDARTANIIWAATISKTGADNVKLFDIGRVSSLGKLSKQAVATLAISLSKSKNSIIADMTTPHDETSPFDVKKVANNSKDDQTIINLVQPPPASTEAASAVARLAQTGKSFDESATYGEKELTALLKDVGSDKLGQVNYKKHFHDSIETSYLLGGNGKSVEVRLVDYLKTATSEKFIQHYNIGAQQITFETLPAFSATSEFSYYHLDIAVGRFGLFLRGPEANKTDIEALGKGIIALLK